MIITIKTENEEEKTELGAKEVTYKKVSDYAVVVRWLEGEVVEKSDVKFRGNIKFLMEQFFSLLEHFRELFRRRVE